MYLINDKVKNEKSIIKKTGLQSLGNIPLNKNNKYLMIENNPKANMMRYIKDVRTNLISNTSEPQIISIISASKGEGKSWIANNIAVALARINKKVLLIDANLREKSNKSDIFYIEQGEGLSDFIRDIEIDNRLENVYKAKKYIKKTQIPNLYVLQNGTISLNSYELIKSKKMREILDLAKEMYDYIIVDGTSYYENTDCINLANMVDSNIIVVEENKTTYSDLLNIKEEIEYNNGQILGFILNKTKLENGKYYAKDNNKKLGMYIENVRENAAEEDSIDEIINPIVTKMEEDATSKFDILHKEIKNGILIEDFINDIETNFNLRLENIEKTSKNNSEYLLEKIDKTEEKIQEKNQEYYAKIREEFDNNEFFSRTILQELQSLKKEITEFKINEKAEKNAYFMQIMEQIQNKNYNEQFNEIRNKIDNISFADQFDEIKNKIENISFENQFNEIKGQIEEIKDKVEKLNYGEQIEEIKGEVEKLKYDDQIKEINQKIKNIEGKGNTETKKSNIIDLRKLFTNEKVFSIDEPISFEELEKMAVEVIDLEEPEGLYKKYN